MQVKYHSKNSLLTPELYKRHPSHDPSKQTKCLYISSNSLERPRIFTDEPKLIIDALYGSLPLKCFTFKNDFHMYMYPVQGLCHMNENVIATTFLRMHALNDVGLLITDAVYGDVCLFGTKRIEGSEKSILDCSVPYEVSEQVFRIYEKIR